MNKEEVEIFYPTTQSEWREWLQKNHRSKQSVWVVFYNKTSKNPTISWGDAVSEALCFGWIDSKKIAIDKEKSHQFFSKRKAKGTWSKINKEKILQLIESGMMTPAGLEVIETAKQNGSWTILDEVEELTIPSDLEAALNTNANAMDFFLGLSKSIKKMLLQWIVLAKRQETRQKRINEIVTNAANKQKPKNF